MTSNHSAAAGLGIARVLAHCGDDLGAALAYAARAVAAAPAEPEAYDLIAELWAERRADLAKLFQRPGSLGVVLADAYTAFLEGDMDRAAMSLGSVTGARPEIAWAEAPWFGDPRFLDRVSADAFAEATMRTSDYGRRLDTEEVRDRLRPWFRVIEVVCERDPRAEAMARMAIFLRACGLIDESFALCDRADAEERIMFTEVVRGGTWRMLGRPEETAAAFERALELEPDNWSLHLDLADTRAAQGDFAAAIRHVDAGLSHEPEEISLLAAGAAFRARLTGSAEELRRLIELAPRLTSRPYLSSLVSVACAGPGLPEELVAEAQRLAAD